MRLRLKLVAGVSVVFCLAAAVHAQPLSIGVKFAGELGGTLAPSDTAGFVPMANWNMTSNFPGTQAITANDGVTPGGTVSWSNITDDWTPAPANGGTALSASVSLTTPDQNLMWGYFDGGTGTGTSISTISVTGLPANIAAGYGVIVYMSGDTSGRVATYQIGNQTVTAQELAASYSNAYTLANATTEGNYLTFTGLSGSSFSLLAGTNPATFNRAPVNGIEIVQIPALVWTGSNGTGGWTTNVLTPKNWQVAGVPSDYTEAALGSTVTFDDTATGTTTVDISSANVTPAGNTTFNNSKLNYTLQSNGGFGIQGAGGLVKTGTGTLTITNSNLFTGPVTLGGGTIAVPFVAVGGQPSPLGAGTSLIFNGGTLSYTGSDATPGTDRTVTVNAGGANFQVANGTTNLSLSGAISGPGSFTKSGPGTLTLTNNFSTTGPTYLTKGTLVITSSTQAGLYEGLVSSTAGSPLDATDPIPQTTVQPVAQYGASTNVGAATGVGPVWNDNTTWGYSGYILNSSGHALTYNFGANFDDDTILTIDGVTAITNNNVWNSNVESSVTLGPGFHTIDLRFGQGGGGAGPNNGVYGSFGVAFNTTGNTLTSGNWLQMGDSTDDPNTQFYASVGGNPNSAMVMSSNTTLDLSATGAGNVFLGSLASASSSTTGAVVLIGGNTLITGVDGTNTKFNGVINDAGLGGSLVKLGMGVFTLTGSNAYTGTTTITGGTLQLGDGTSGNDGSLTTSGIVNNAALVYNLFGSQTASYPISGIGSLTKLGTGTLTLTGSSSYTGPTGVNTGTLVLGANSAVAAASSVTVKSGATLSLVGNAQLASNSIFIQPGGLFNVTAASPAFSLGTGQTLTAGRTGTPGTDIQGSVTLSGGAVNIGNGVGTIATLTAPTGTFTLGGGAVNFDVTNVSTTSGGTNDTVNVANLALTGPTTLNINPIDYSLGSGFYKLFNTTGSISGGTSNLILNLQNIALGSTRQSFSLVTTSNAVELDVIGNAGNLIWTGANSPAWNVVGTQNWTNGGLADYFYNNDFVNFDDTANTGSVTLAANVLPGGMTFSNNTLTYTLSGTGSIGGPAAYLNKTGSGTVILANANGNVFGGPTTIGAGLLVLGNANAVQNSTVNVNVDNGLGFTPGIGTFNLGGLAGSGALALSDTAGVAVTLSVGSNGASTAYAGVISGIGGLTMAGTGTLTLTSANTYSGSTLINNGAVQLGNALAAQNSTVTVNAANGLLFSPAIGAFSVGGLSGAGSFGLLDTSSSAVALTVGGNGQNTTFSGAITGAGSLVKVGTGELSLSGTGIRYQGNTTVNSGTLQLYNALNFSVGSVPPNTFSIASSAVLEIYTDSSGTAVDTANQVFGSLNGGSTITGSGVFRKTGNGILGSGQGVGGVTTMTFAMSPGALIDVENGTLRNGGWQSTAWTWTTTSGTVTTTNYNSAALNIGTSGTFDVWDGNAVYVDALTGPGLVTKGQGTGNVNLNVGVAGGSGTFSGVIQNPQTGYEGNDITGSSISLVKAGSGLQVLTGSSTYTGETTVSGGTLQVGNGGSGASIGSTAGVILANNATLVFSHSDAETFIPNISGAGNLTKAGNGTLTLQGYLPYSGTTAVTKGTLVISPTAVNTPGLWEGVVAATQSNHAIDNTDPIPLTSIQSVARFGTSTQTGGTPVVYPYWPNYTTIGYSGYLDNTTSGALTYTFGKGFDDAASVTVDGKTIINDSTYTDEVTGQITLSPGLHTVDLRFYQGTGGVGPAPAANPPYGAFGVGYNTVGATGSGDPSWTQVGAGDSTFDTEFFATISGLPNSPVVLSSNTTLDLSAAGLGNVFLGSLADATSATTGHQVLIGSNTLDVGLNNASTTFSGTISDLIEGVSQGGSLVKQGAGTFLLAGSNSYTGSTTVYNGILEAATVAALPGYSSNLVTVGPGAVLAMRTGNGTNGWSVAQINNWSTVNFSDSTAGVGLDTTNGNFTYPNAIPQPLTKLGPNTLTLTGTSTYLGPTTVSAGTLQLGDGATSSHDGALSTSGINIGNGAGLIYNQVANRTVNYAINGPGTVTKLGTNKLTLTGVTTYAGPTFVTGGTLALNTAPAPGLNEGVVSITQGSALDATDPIPVSAAGIQPVARWGSDTNVGSNATGYPTYPVWNNNTTIGYSGILYNTSTGSVTYNFGANFDDDAVLKIDGTTVVDNNNTWNSNVESSFPLTPGPHIIDLRFGQGGGGAGPNTGAYGSFGVAYNTTGNTATTGTWNQMGASDADTEFFATLPGESFSSMVMSSNTTLDLSGTSAFGSVVALGSLADATSATTGHQVYLGGNTLETGLDGTNTTFSGTIYGSGGLNKVGGGLFTLAGANTYAGSTTVSSGTLQIGNGGTTGSINAASNVVTNATLAFNRSDNIVFPNTVSGIGGLTQLGPGMLTLTGSSSYTGQTNVTGGTLQVGNGGSGASIGSTSGVALANNSALVFNHADNVNFGALISGTGSLTKTGSGTLTLSILENYNGPTVINGGTLKVAAPLSIGVQFQGGGNAIGAAYNGALPMTNWNTFTGNTLGTQAGTLHDANNNPGVAVLNSFQGTGTWYTNSSIPLLSGYIDNASATGNDSVTISNIPYASYNVYAYFGADGGGRTGSVQLGTGTTYYYSTEGDGNETGYFATTSTTTASYPTANYAEWTGVSGGSLSIEQFRGSNNSGIHGIEIVDTTPGDAGASLPATTPVTISNGSTLDLTNVIQTIASLSSTDGKGSKVLLGDGALTVGNSATTTFDGTISGVGGALIKQGSGELVLSGTNTYTGGTTVLDGTLLVTNNAGLATGSGMSVGAGAPAIFGLAAAPAAPAGGAHAAAAVSAVPEPGTLALLVAGLVVGFGVWRRRKGI